MAIMQIGTDLSYVIFCHWYIPH